MNDKLNSNAFAKKIKDWGIELGFNHVGITDANLKSQKKSYEKWIKLGFHGNMDYLKRHQNLKFSPERLVKDTISIISVRLDYMPLEENTLDVLKDKNRAYISRYALGRDYHKVIRSKLKKLAEKIKNEAKQHSTNIRVFTDSAPVLEVGIAEKAGLGWRGKHTLLLNKDHGSWFFLGEIYTNLSLPYDNEVTTHCGSCKACIDICPTNAIIAPYKLDARKCISYLTIENKNEIPIEYRKAIGNRVYGCDDCQLVCPWNKYAKITGEKDFLVRHDLNNLSLIDSFKFSEEDFDNVFKGSAIYRIGYQQWLRNIAVGLGNAPKSKEILEVLKDKLNSSTSLVKDHIVWAIEQHK
ncbi:tRNA epoxyqueuosine(34) reductase QueG [Methylophilaceae bacterium]|nr:tRNA epoxyqueuosine(34) reductase QueG [Methylophilaceae bacterium]